MPEGGGRGGDCNAIPVSIMDKYLRGILLVNVYV